MKYLVEAAFYCTVVVEADDAEKAEEIVSSLDTLSLLANCSSVDIEVLNELSKNSELPVAKVYNCHDVGKSLGLLTDRS